MFFPGCHQASSETTARLQNEFFLHCMLSRVAMPCLGVCVLVLWPAFRNGFDFRCFLRPPFSRYPSVLGSPWETALLFLWFAFTTRLSLPFILLFTSLSFPVFALSSALPYIIYIMNICTENNKKTSWFWKIFHKTGVLLESFTTFTPQFQ